MRNREGEGHSEGPSLREEEIKDGWTGCHPGIAPSLERRSAKRYGDEEGGWGEGRGGGKGRGE